MNETTNEAKTYIQQMSEDMAKIKESLDLLSKYGISMELMIMYIQSKTRLSKSVIKIILDYQKEFLREAFKPMPEKK